MTFILDGNHVIGAQCEIGQLVCLRHLFPSTSLANSKFIFIKDMIFLHMRICSELPSNISTMACILLIFLPVAFNHTFLYAFIAKDPVKFTAGPGQNFREKKSGDFTRQK